MGKAPLDPYTTLRVVRTADIAVIRAAYRGLARHYHPDLNPDPMAGEHMARINEAYGILVDPAARAAYDQNSGLVASTPAWAVPPPMPPSRHPGAQPPGSVLDFGRYTGYSIGELAHLDPDYLRWLASSRIGVSYCAEIDAALTAVGSPLPVGNNPRKRFGR